MKPLIVVHFELNTKKPFLDLEITSPRFRKVKRKVNRKRRSLLPVYVDVPVLKTKKKKVRLLG